MKHTVLGKCPVCSKELVVTDIKCTSCSTRIQGEFMVNKFSRLNERQIKFVEVFLKCRGNIKEVEKELGISYPTVKSRLDDVAEILELDIIPDMEGKRKSILEGIEKGEITVNEAVEMLKTNREV